MFKKLFFFRFIFFNINHTVYSNIIIIFAPNKRNKQNMSQRLQEFETKLDALLKDFSDVPYEDLAESLEYYSISSRMKAEHA